ncbi:MAG: prolipoprotein diacylglyceryl transferase [Gammaproteobacteria bacterium]|nr:prolipoprotein diacylglyceryl transferase [Gammaproteobacteria bacterium]
MALHFFFDVAAWLSMVLMTNWLYRLRFRQAFDRFGERLGGRYFVAITLGGLAGAYGFGTLNLFFSGTPGFARSALGGLVGAIAAVEYYKSRRGVRGSTGAVFAVPLCMGLAIGRLGCFFGGLPDQTVGNPTDLPAGVDFGDGVRRHPVQLYESLSMALAALVLGLGVWRRAPLAMTTGFYLAVGWYAAQRFLWEFLKPYGAIVGPLNLFHLLCLLLFAYALIMAGRNAAATSSRPVGGDA